MSTAGDFCARRVIDVPGRWAGGGVLCVRWGIAGPCLWVVVLIMWQLGRLIVDKQRDYERLCGRLVGEASDLSGPEEISQGGLKLTLKMLL